MQGYLEALLAEIQTLGVPQPMQTVFLGGGTPTYLEVRMLARLLKGLRQWLPLAEGGEFTVEANPDSLTEEKMEVLRSYGVNRVSLGAQSFESQMLKVLERQHDPQAIAAAVQRVQKTGAVVSLDLIFGVPGQSLEQWGQDLKRALALQPDHVSTYGLTYEKGTRLWKQRRQGELRPLTEEEELGQYRLAREMLEGAGYEHYEISNFAFPGRRSRHNQVYWANEAYFGFGLGAARYVEGVRSVNIRELQGYMQRALAGESVTQQVEQLEPRERARETMAVQLRRKEGIERQGFREQTGYHLDEVASEKLSWLVEAGFLEDEGKRVALTCRGQEVADAVIEKLL